MQEFKIFYDEEEDILYLAANFIRSWFFLSDWKALPFCAVHSQE